MLNSIARSSSFSMDGAPSRRTVVHSTRSSASCTARVPSWPSHRIPDSSRSTSSRVMLVFEIAAPRREMVRPSRHPREGKSPCRYRSVTVDRTPDPPYQPTMSMSSHLVGASVNRSVLSAQLDPSACVRIAFLSVTGTLIGSSASSAS